MQTKGKTPFFIFGSALRGQPDHGNLGAAEFVAEARTEPRYRLHDGHDGWHPAICEAERPGAGIAIPGEVYALTEDQLSNLLASEPPDLVLSSVALDTGKAVAAMLCPAETIAQHGFADISEYGGWAAFKAARNG